LSAKSGNGTANVRVKLLFVDRGEFHTESVSVPAERLSDYDRLVDLLREDPAVTRELYIDFRRLVSAVVAEDSDD
jgi:hypothetical protein